MTSFLGILFADGAIISCFVSDRNQQGPPIPQYAYYTIGRLLKLVSVYAAHHYLVQSHIPVVLFVFYCLLGATALFTIIQQPWTGRNLPRAQVTYSCSTDAERPSCLILCALAIAYLFVPAFCITTPSLILS